MQDLGYETDHLLWQNRKAEWFLDLEVVKKTTSLLALTKGYICRSDRKSQENQDVTTNDRLFGGHAFSGISVYIWDKRLGDDCDDEILYDEQAL